jgi:hypothetical protein
VLSANSLVLESVAAFSDRGGNDIWGFYVWFGHLGDSEIVFFHLRHYDRIIILTKNTKGYHFPELRKNKKVTIFLGKIKA